MDDNELDNQFLRQAQVRQGQSAGDWAKALLRQYRPESVEEIPPDQSQGLTDGPASAQTMAGKGLSTIGNVVGDVVKGAVMAPVEIPAGIHDMARNVVGTAGIPQHLVGEALKSLGEWMDSEGVKQFGEKMQSGAAKAPDLLGKKIDPISDTVTGNVVRGASSFLSVYAPVLNAMRGAGATGSISGPMGAGAVTDIVNFDPQNKNLSSLIQSFPALQNPVNEYLASDPNSPEALNRLRNAVEGAGFGLVAEGVVRGIRVLANKQGTAQSLQEGQKAAYGELTPEQTRILGDPNPAAPLVTVIKQKPADVAATLDRAEKYTETGVPTDVVAKGLTGAADDATYKSGLARALGEDVHPSTKELGFQFNWARIGGSDDLDAVVGDMMKAFKGEINEARRGEITLKAQRQMATNLGMSPEDLLSRQTGQAFNAEQLIASNDIFKAAHAKTLDLARAAANPNASPMEEFAFRRMMTLTAAINEKFLGGAAEAGRALGALRVIAGDGVEQARQLQLFMDTTSRQGVNKGLAQAFIEASESGIPGATARFVKTGWTAMGVDMVRESRAFSLLWRPTTHARNIGGNAMVMMQQIADRSVATKIGDVLGSAVDARVVDGEAVAYTYGILSSMRDAMKLALKAGKEGQSSFIGSQWIDNPLMKSITSERVAVERGAVNTAETAKFAETAWGKAIDYLGNAIRGPGHALAFGDEFFKVLNYRGEAHALALRESTKLGNIGPERWKKMMEIQNDPPPWLRIAAEDTALYATFQSKLGKIGQNLLKARDDMGTLNPMFLGMQYVATPVNIARYGFEHSALAPFAGQWRAELAAGGARRDLALAKVSAGAFIFANALHFANEGYITGQGYLSSKDKGKREALERQGWQRNALRVGDKYLGFNSMDPAGQIMNAAGMIAEVMKQKELGSEDYDELTEIGWGMVGVLSVAVGDKAITKGLMEVMKLVDTADESDGEWNKWWDRNANSLVPFISLSDFARRFKDPVTRDVNSPIDGIMARIAGLSERLPAARTLWGREVRDPHDLINSVSPVKVTTLIPSPIDSEIIRLGAEVRRINKNGGFEGADIQFRDFPHVYEEYVKLAGHELKLPQYGDLGAEDFLNAVVSGTHPLSQMYHSGMLSDGPHGGKTGFIKGIIEEYRSAAREQIMTGQTLSAAKSPEFVPTVRKKQTDKEQQKLPPGIQLQAPERPYIAPFQKRSDAAPAIVTQISDALTGSESRMQERSDKSSAQINEKFARLLERDDARSQEIAELRKLATSDREFIRDEKTGALSRYKLGDKEYEFKRDKNNRITGMTVGKG